MELKPIKNKAIAYPTIKEISNTDPIKELLIAITLPIRPEAVDYVAVSSYVRPINICNLIRSISIIITILSSILLIINKLKITKCINNNGDIEKIKKLKKYKKIRWWIFGISVSIIIITSFIIFYLENYM